MQPAFAWPACQPAVQPARPASMPKRRTFPPPPPCADGEIALRTHDADAFERAEAHRRRYKHPHERCGPGNRESSWRAIARVNTVLTPCGGCGTLCAWPRVLRAAFAADGVAIAPAHGCAARGCSNSREHKPPRHAATQRRWVAQLRSGERLLIERPTRVEQHAARDARQSQVTRSRPPSRQR